MRHVWEHKLQRFRLYLPLYLLPILCLTCKRTFKTSKIYTSRARSVMDYAIAVFYYGMPIRKGFKMYLTFGEKSYGYYHAYLYQENNLLYKRIISWYSTFERSLRISLCCAISSNRIHNLLPDWNEISYNFRQDKNSIFLWLIYNNSV